MKNYRDGGEAILAAFRALGIDYIISSPGSEWSSVWEALARQKTSGAPGPAYIDCWHETLAIDMALGYVQATGRLQAVLLHAGAGLLQGAAGIHAAQLAEMPLLVMSGESLSYGEDPNFEPGSQWYRSLSIVGGPQRLIEPVVKWSSQATSIHTLYESVVRAGELAQRGPRGPVYLNVPVEVMLQPWTPREQARLVPAAPKARPSSDAIAEVAALVLAAKAPVIVTESAGRDPDGMVALVELAELMAIPVVEGRACAYANFPKDHPLYRGNDIDPFLPHTDLALAVASRVPWYPPGNRPTAGTVVSIDANPLKGHMAYQSLQADIYLEGDVTATLRLLTAALRDAGATPAASRARFDACRSVQQTRQTALRQAEAKAAELAAIDPLVLCAALQAAMPEDTIYVDETVVHSPMVHAHLSWTLPQSYFYVHGGLGQGLGLALGIKLARPQRPVVLLIGDGSFLYNPIAQALGASKGNALPLLVVVFNNRKYQAMKNNHLRYYPDGVAADAQLFHGVEIDGPDYAELGRPFGFHGEKVETPAALPAALENAKAAVASGRTAILNVLLNR